MDQERIAKIIKKIRLENNLTQKEFADKLGVTYQAVSKWENAKNIPDISILKEIKKLYNIDLDDLLDGENKPKRKNYIFIAFLILIIILLVILILFTSKKEDFTFKQISTTCDNFNINGSVAYNENKKVIYISNIEYCGDVNNEIYKEIECSMYESYKDTDTKIKSCKKLKNITLEDYLKKTTITVEHISQTCKMFTKSDVYLLINATSKDNIVTAYKIPIKLEECN